MLFSSQNLENHLLESKAGGAVYDALVQANIDLRTVSVELVKQMLVAEYRQQRRSVCGTCPEAFAAC